MKKENHHQETINGEFTVKPELPIGTEFWIMKDNRLELGLVAAFNVCVTSCVDSKRGWRDQLFGRWINKEAKKVWTFSISYELKLETEIVMFRATKKKGVWYLSDRKMYFSIDELKSDM